MSKLVIVESPAKAKTISKFLGRGFLVKSSFGHIRDLPKGDLGIDVENNFAPHYIIPRDKQKIATDLKKSAIKTKEILFATDEDREGEAISWHLAHLLKIDPKDVKRLVFHEITESAIKEAIKHPRPLNLNLVDAQQARRVLDRLVGYKLSPFLWKKVARGLSAGRVQSVTVRLIVEREREIQKFKPEEYWTVEAIFSKNQQNFVAKLQAVDGKTLDKLEIKSKDEAEKILKDLEKSSYTVAKLEQKKTKKQPPAPFTTSTLQQRAYKHLGFSAKQTMMLAQQLYEGIDVPGHGSFGLITYMRTDSVNLSEKFLKDSRDFIKQKFGSDYLPLKPIRYTTKSKLAQEAHEAIRPTEASLTSESLKNKIDSKLWKLYDLIWTRAVASQMNPAVFEATAVDILDDSQKFLFRATGNILIFQGFLALFPNSPEENELPPLKEKEKLNLIKIDPFQHFTEPPPRYNDATIVKTLEEYGIGRPSTYAPTIATIIARKYIERDEKKRFIPTDIGFLVTDILIQHFPKIVDYQFTAKMEDNFDTIANGKISWVEIIKQFYLPFAENLENKYSELTKKELTEEKTKEICEKCGSPMIIKTGRFGRFLACSNYPQCKNTKQIISGSGDASGTFQTEPPLDEKCPQCGSPLMRRHGRFGAFISCSNYPECKYIKKEEKGTGIKCPKCGQGEIVERRTRKKRLFYSCGRYPNCDFALWQKPTGEICPKCQSLIVMAGKEKTKCSNPNCQ